MLMPRNVNAVKEVLQSRDLLLKMMHEVGLREEYESVEKFIEAVQVDEVRGTGIVEIKYKSENIGVAQDVVKAITTHFMTLCTKA